MEMIKEGWVEFERIKCTEGYIDYWTGDAVNHPNDLNEKSFKLNRKAEFYRTNTSPWLNASNFPNGFLETVREESELFTASEIYTEGLFGK